MRRSSVRTALLLLATFAALSAGIAAAPLAAQTPAPAPAAPPPAASQPSTAADSQAVLAVVTKLFDAMRARDTASLRAAFAPGAGLLSSGVRNGQPTVQRDSIGSWIASVGRAPAGTVLDERLYNPQVQLSDGLAHVWVEYDLYVGERFSHCGVDSILLARTADGWRIVNVADTRRQEGCPSRQ